MASSEINLHLQFRVQSGYIGLVYQVAVYARYISLLAYPMAM